MDYQKAIALAPDLPYPYLNRGLIYNDQGDYARAVTDFDKAIELEPDLASAYLGRGLAYAKLGKKAEASADYKKVLEISQDSYQRKIAEQRLHDLGAR
jgi:tetratricopeptide (TPR) repeat protein